MSNGNVPRPAPRPSPQAAATGGARATRGGDPEPSSVSPGQRPETPDDSRNSASEIKFVVRIGIEPLQSSGSGGSGASASDLANLTASINFLQGKLQELTARVSALESR